MDVSGAVRIPPVEAPDNTDHAIRRYAQVLASLTAIKDTIDVLSPSAIFTLGGDCGIDAPIISHLSRFHGDRLGVVWIDAHADANTPQTSPSGYFHGMPVRCLCAEGDGGVCATAFSHLRPHAFVYFGARDMDPAERDWVAKHRVLATNTAAELVNYLQAQGLSSVAIHLDLDVLDPGAFGHVACPAPGGRSVAEIAVVLAAISNEFTVVGATIAECTARRVAELEPIQPLLRWWQAAADAG
jgi:arginase